jgi:TonB family protein
VLALAALIIVARPRRGQAPVKGEESGTVTTETAELRREASEKAAVLASLARGAHVTVLADAGPWLSARSDKGETGFLPAESVERDSDRRARERRAEKILSFPPVFGVVAEDAPVRLAPFPLAARAGRLARGSTIAIHAVDHDYFAFKAADGGLAFVQSDAVDLVPPDPRKPAIPPATGSRELKDLAINDVAVASAPVAPPAEGSESVPPENAEPPETSDEALEPAVLLSKIDPVYPESARRAGVDGTVVLDALVGKSGRVEEVQVLRGLPLGLSDSAVEAVRRWQYRPARGKSGPVASHKTVRIVFTLGAR